MKRKLAAICSAVALMLIAWFLIVDLSWFVENCPDCGLGRDVIQYRLAGFCVNERMHEWTSTIQLVAIDLDAECTHPTIKRWHKHRYWGLLYCAAPCINGTLRLSDGAWYDEAKSAKIRALGSSRPGLRDEFRKQVLVKHDFEFYRRILTDAGIELDAD